MWTKVECPTGSGDYMNLVAVAEEIQHRIIHIFGRDVEGRRATNGGNVKLDYDPHFRDYVWFYEVPNTFDNKSNVWELTIFCSFLHSVLPCGQWARSWCVASDRLVRPCCVPHPAKWCELPATQDTPK